MAQVHLRSLLSLAGTEVCGVAGLEVMPAVFELCESQAVPVGTSMKWLLGSCRPDVIVVATPTDTHAHLVATAARAGCHVFCEKPLGRTAAEAAESLAVCEQAGVKLSVGHVVRYFPAYARIAEMVKSGQIGPPGLAKCQRVSGPPGAAGEWYADASRSGGLLLDMGVHDFDWLRWCLGPVQRVSAVTSRSDLGQAAMVVLAHASGAISVVELSWMDPGGFATSVEVSGPNGLVRHDSRRSSNYSTELWPAAEGEPSVRVQAERVDERPLPRGGCRRALMVRRRTGAQEHRPRRGGGGRSGRGGSAQRSAWRAAAGRRSSSARRTVMARLPVAILGAGHVHAPSYVRRLLAHPDVELVGIYDETASTAQRLSEQVGTVAFGSVQEALERARAVAVCPEPTRQLALVQAAASAGLPVLCEKPFGTTFAEATALLRLSEKVPVSVALVVRYHPAAIKLKVAVQSGALGASSSRVGHQSQLVPGRLVRRPFFGRRWLSPRPPGPRS